MASGQGIDFEAQLTIDLFAELIPISYFQLSEPEDNIAMGSARAPLTTELPENAPNIETENVNKTPSQNLMSAVSDHGASGPEENASALPFSDSDETDFQSAFQGQEVPEPDELPLDLQLLFGKKKFGAKIKLTVIVSMVSPFGEDDETLTHAGDFIIEAFPCTTIRAVKYAITEMLDICYEDMALVFVGKFLSDARTLDYYYISDGQTMHLLVETPNKMFKDLFESFKGIGLGEERAWFATRSFIHIAHTKFNDNNVLPTEELLLKELEELYVPDTDESDVSSADEDEPGNEINYTNVVTFGGMELGAVGIKTDKNEESDGDLEENDGDQNLEDQNKNYFQYNENGNVNDGDCSG